MVSDLGCAVEKAISDCFGNATFFSNLILFFYANAEIIGINVTSQLLRFGSFWID